MKFPLKEGFLLPKQAKDLETNGLSAMVENGEALKKRVEQPQEE